MPLINGIMILSQTLCLTPLLLSWSLGMCSDPQPATVLAVTLMVLGKLRCLCAGFVSAELSLGDICGVAAGEHWQGSAREAGRGNLTVDT